MRSSRGAAPHEPSRLLLIQELKLRQRPSPVCWLRRWPEASAVAPPPYAHRCAWLQSCQPLLRSVFGHRFSRSVAASLLSVGVLDGDLSISEREHVAALDLNTNAIVPSA